MIVKKHFRIDRNKRKSIRANIEVNNALLELNEVHDDFIKKITEFQNYKTY